MLGSFKKVSSASSIIRTCKQTAVRFFSIGLLTTLFAASSYAAHIEWDFTGSGGVGSYANVRTFTSGGITITATAWGYTYGSSNNALETAALGQWSTGLGVCDRDETVSNCSTPNHQVDNMGADNFVLFIFSTPVDPYYIEVDPYGVWDRDVSYRLGNVNPAINLNGKNYGSDLTALGFGDWITQTYTASGDPIDIDIAGTNLVNALLFGAKTGEYSGSERDAFKITELEAGTGTVTITTTVPEPSSLMLLATGLVGLAFSRRKVAK